MNRIRDAEVPATRIALLKLLPCLRKLAQVGVSVAFLTGLTGCHHQSKVSRSSYPSPPPATAGRSGNAGSIDRSTSLPLPPTIAVPVPGDNAVPAAGVLTGYASWYAPSGRHSSNGEMYDGGSLTAAHRTLPLETLVRVTNLATGQAATVRITDRGPFVHGRMLDLSVAAAKTIGMYRMGVAPVRMEILQPGPGVSPEGRWCVQVGAFVSTDRADNLRAELTRQYGTSARIAEFRGATGMWVRIDPAQSDRKRALAIIDAMSIEEPTAQAWLVRLD